MGSASINRGMHILFVSYVIFLLHNEGQTLRMISSHSEDSRSMPVSAAAGGWSSNTTPQASSAMFAAFV